MKLSANYPVESLVGKQARINDVWYKVLSIDFRPKCATHREVIYLSLKTFTEEGEEFYLWADLSTVIDIK